MILIKNVIFNPLHVTMINLTFSKFDTEEFYIIITDINSHESIIPVKDENEGKEVLEQIYMKLEEYETAIEFETKEEAQKFIEIVREAIKEIAKII